MTKEPSRLAVAIAHALRLAAGLTCGGAVLVFATKPEGVAQSARWLQAHGVQGFAAIAAAIVMWVAAGIVDGTAKEPGPGAALRDNTYATGGQHDMQD